MVEWSENTRSPLQVEDDHTSFTCTLFALALGGQGVKTHPDTAKLQPLLPTLDPIVQDMVILSLPHQLAQASFTHSPFHLS